MNAKLQSKIFLFCILLFCLETGAMTGFMGSLCINKPDAHDLAIWNICINLKLDSAVSELILDGLYIDDNAAALIAEGLKENRYLRTLSMATTRKSLKCIMGTPGISALCAALKVNKSLRSLNLSGHNVGYQGAKILFQALEEHGSLTELNIANCFLSNEAAEEIIKSLKKNSSLLNITLRSDERLHARNTIGLEAFNRIKKMLSRNRKMADILLCILGSANEKSVFIILPNELRKHILLLVAALMFAND